MEYFLKCIPLSAIKRDNSNITYYSRSLWKELRKERGKNHNLENLYYFYEVEKDIKGSIYDDIDLCIDIHRFKERLTAQEKEYFDYYLEGMSVKEIAQMMARSIKAVYWALTSIKTKV